VARRLCRLVQAVPDKRVAGYDADVGDCKWGSISSLCELRARSGDGVGGGGTAGVIYAALLERIVACVGECADAYGFARCGDGRDVVYSADDSGREWLFTRGKDAAVGGGGSDVGGRVVSGVVGALSSRRDEGESGIVMRRPGRGANGQERARVPWRRWACRENRPCRRRSTGRALL